MRQDWKLDVCFYHLLFDCISSFSLLLTDEMNPHSTPLPLPQLSGAQMSCPSKANNAINLIYP